MAAEKACKKCKTLFTGAKCPKCGGDEKVDTYKGKVYVFEPEKSELAKELGLKESGKFAVRLR
ncbi:hypothetical protein COU62_02950 [Candidatus Pacearchaeota archaeon CG10_big_fil_rev_8_21_14_0_10_35_219]|nr:hypothetical protein [Candidatus Pacearchaeota archaeon]OIO42617.1 MAG: hypothetical protein AUJ63_02405 [Candidatus Pacearchaeota archaeon CG1_02_35_32]PIO07587.1 MAG: hypothetical protein COU62_02950 [Candidatus Pacearchaeota archaeon CG10_big_fil_rev_8_21_14_0_10_35_219]PIY81923.1 MAG: hypothetical protein COY79_00110 [Candidatus Pacearchaeota archaeon CG_4_10_14_0_8_um_filter_35_169]PIZ80576.1 MAG: hypothetical protein COY00_00925 [Candidatus Pacearchaeota archaeon CG_4_10_14_0_2_um_filt